MGVLGVEARVGGGADHRAVPCAENGERKAAVGTPVGERVGDPGPRLLEVRRPRIREPGEDLIGIGSSKQASGVLGA